MKKEIILMMGIMTSFAIQADVVNGGFDDAGGSLNGWTSNLNPNNDGNVASTAVRTIHNDVTYAESGSYFGSFQTYYDSSIYQAFDTVIDQEYQLLYYFAVPVAGAIANYEQSVLDIDVYSDSISGALSDGDGNLLDETLVQADVASFASAGWIAFTNTFTASSTTSYLRFYEDGSVDQGAVLDSISVAAIPEPATLGLLMAAFVGGVLFIRRFTV